MSTQQTSRLASLAVAAAIFFTPFSTMAATTGAFSAGDLIKGETNKTVYYFAADGRRYVFPNEKTYFTWYTDFSGVKTIKDAQLAVIPLGRSNITYRPGVKMVKIQSDPKVYAVDRGGVLRLVPSEQLAQTLYGINWKNKIDDVADAFFVNYRTGSPLAFASDFNPSNVATASPNITVDKSFDDSVVNVSIGDIQTSFVPTTITIKKGQTVIWTNQSLNQHTVTSNTGVFDSGKIEPTLTYTRTFNSVGSFDYHCSIHPTMRGTINVIP